MPLLLLEPWKPWLPLTGRRFKPASYQRPSLLSVYRHLLMAVTPEGPVMVAMEEIQL